MFCRCTVVCCSLEIPAGTVEFKVVGEGSAAAVSVVVVIRKIDADRLVGLDRRCPGRIRRGGVAATGVDLLDDHIRADRSGSGDREARTKDGRPQNTA